VPPLPNSRAATKRILRARYTMTEKPHQDGTAFFAAVESAIAYGGGSLGGMSVADAFNAAASHVAVLLSDAVKAFQRKSYGTCVFLAITALEEAAKVDLLAFRVKSSPAPNAKRGRDPLLSHRKKHIIAVRPTVFMGGRLQQLLGDPTCARLQKEAEAGALVQLREQSLYVHADENGVTTPATAITASRAHEVLLLALVSADDILVGWTNASYALGERFDAWIAEVGP